MKLYYDRHLPYDKNVIVTHTAVFSRLSDLRERSLLLKWIEYLYELLNICVAIVFCGRVLKGIT